MWEFGPSPFIGWFPQLSPSSRLGVGQRIASAPRSIWRFEPSALLSVAFEVRPPFGTFGVGQRAFSVWSAVRHDEDSFSKVGGSEV